MKKIVTSLVLSLLCATSIVAVPVKFSVVTDQNKRDYQEDRYICTTLTDPDDKKIGDFFGIYDGHGGDKASTLLAKELHEHIFPLFHLDCNGKWCIEDKNQEDCFKWAFYVMEKKALQSFDDGSTAVVGYVDTNNMLHMAWAGDSRLVLDKGFATQDHKPDRPDEKERIENAGGKVVVYGVPRVNGLAVSRSIGDRKLKNDGWSREIISTPEYAQHQLTKDNAFAIMASDGLWDVVNNDMAIAMVKKMVQSGKSYDDAAHALKNEAIKRGSGDNITIIIAQFDWSE